MKPREQRDSGQGDLLRSRLDQIIDMRHPLVALARKVDWAFLEKTFGEAYTDGPGQRLIRLGRRRQRQRWHAPEARTRLAARRWRLLRPPCTQRPPRGGHLVRAAEEILSEN